MTFGSFNERNNDRIIDINNNFNRINNNENPILLNNPIENLFQYRNPVNNNNINSNANFANNLISFTNYNDLYNINKNIKLPWLNKQKMTEEIKIKYKNEKCSICLDELMEIFRYQNVIIFFIMNVYRVILIIQAKKIVRFVEVIYKQEKKRKLKLIEISMIDKYMKIIF